MKIVIHPDFMQTADFIKQLPQHFAQEGELLYEGRNEVRRYRVKNEWLVVKKYKQPNIIQRIVYTTLPCPKCCGNAGSTNMPQTSWPRSWCNCTKKEYYMAT